jgi:hypothetical protein
MGLKSPGWGVALALGPLAWVAARMASPAWVEAHFVTGVSQPVAQALGAVTGRVAWPVAQVGLAALIVGVLAAVAVGLARPGRAAWLRRAAPRGLAVLSTGYAVFVAIWGLNYARQPLFTAFALDDRPPSLAEVRSLTAELVTATNRARETTPEGPDGVARLAGDFADAARRAQDAYARAGVRWPFLAGTYAPAKAILASNLISYTGLGGIYIPFTAEPNVNVDGPAFDHPFDICHEMAHQRGVAREDEANFVAYVVCRDYGDPDFRYSVTLTAAAYAANALEEVDNDAAVGLWANLGLGTRRDLAARRAWTERHTSPLKDVGSEVNHAYLKSNGVADGVASYSRVVQLLVAERRARRGAGGTGATAAP